MKNHIERLFRI